MTVSNSERGREQRSVWWCLQEAARTLLQWGERRSDVQAYAAT